jgi:hypothetical protein
MDDVAEMSDRARHPSLGRMRIGAGRGNARGNKTPFFSAFAPPIAAGTSPPDRAVAPHTPTMVLVVVEHDDRTGACLAARTSAHACRDAERLSDGSRWFFMPQLRGLLCAATASRSSSSFFRITLLPRISGGWWRYTRGKQTIWD